MKPKLYFAARYSRRIELCGYRRELDELGYCVTSRWLNGAHQVDDAGQPIGDEGERLVEGREDERRLARELRNRFAVEDVEDVRQADILVAFTEQPRSVASRGGRHVEFGLALALGKRMWIVGPRENLFHWGYDSIQFPEWFDCYVHLKRLATPAKPRLLRS